MNAPGSPSSALQRTNFCVALSIAGELPLHTGREAAAATSAQSALFDLVDDLLRGHFGKRLGKGGVTVPGDVFIDVRGIDNTAVPQHHLLLELEERHIGDRLVDLVRITVAVQKLGYDSALSADALRLSLQHPRL